MPKAQAAAAHPWHRQARRRQSPAAVARLARHEALASPLVVRAAGLGALRAERSLLNSSGAVVQFVHDAVVVPAGWGRVLPAR